MPTVSELHLHPVKACGRIEVDEATVGPHGFVGDREWQVCAADGTPLTQRTHPMLATVRPELIDGGLMLRAPGRADLAVEHPGDGAEPVTVKELTGTEVELVDAGDAAARWSSGLVGESVRLYAIGATYQRPLGGPLPWASAALGDLCPMLLANDASLLDLQAAATAPFGMERFRPNVVIEGVPAWDEDTWAVVRIGEATAVGGVPWPRCAVPQVDQETGERHQEPAKVLAATRWCVEAVGAPEGLAHLFEGSTLFGAGVGMDPVGATIRVGDEVEVLERREPFILR
ncbi:MAG: MOSC N-terminal beta barrel domain-containing protein [Actinomycetota bacterium]